MPVGMSLFHKSDVNYISTDEVRVRAFSLCETEPHDSSLCSRLDNLHVSKITPKAKHGGTRKLSILIQSEIK